MTDPPDASISPSRTVLITGGNSGLGYECARVLAADPAWHVVLACRDIDRAREAVGRLRGGAPAAADDGPAPSVEAMQLDLGSLGSVRGLAGEVARRLAVGEIPPLRGLICNAGVQAGAAMTSTVDGFEGTFGVNHLGHFLMVNLLLPSLSPPARILVVASGVHDPAQKTPIPPPAWNDPFALARGELGAAGSRDSPAQAGRRRYATSKLANVLFSSELARRLPEGLAANAFDPGLMPGTGLAREAVAPLRWLWDHVLPRAIPLLRRVLSANTHTPAESGAALARLLTDPALEGRSGEYFEGTRAIPPSEESRDLARASELWRASVTLTGLDGPPARLPGSPAPAG